MNAQQMVDKIAAHMVAQGQPSFDPEKQKCMYRFGDLRCAAGWLLLDEEYQEDFEGEPVTKFKVRMALARSGVPQLLIHLLREVQRAHDSTVSVPPEEFVATFADQLQSLCDDHNLLLPAILQGQSA